MAAAAGGRAGRPVAGPGSLRVLHAAGPSRGGDHTDRRGTIGNRAATVWALCPAVRGDERVAPGRDDRRSRFDEGQVIHEYARMFTNQGMSVCVDSCGVEDKGMIW